MNRMHIILGLGLKSKSEVELNDLLYITDNCFALLVAFCHYADTNKLPKMITSIFSDTVEGRVSRTHAEKRAIDFSRVGWTNEHIDECCRFINNNYKEQSCVNTKGETVGLIYHDAGNSTGFHFHLQARV